MLKVGVVGLGNWGTALANHLANKGYDVLGWATNKEVVKSINIDNKNLSYQKDVSLCENLKATNNIDDLKNSKILLLAVPSASLAEVAAKLPINDNMIIVSAIKGLEKETLKTPIAYIMSKLNIDKDNVAVLSGPSFANDVIRFRPCGVVSASFSEDTAKNVANIFTSDSMRVYFSVDPIGVEIGAVVKNVIALAAGVCDGMELGESAKAVLITRGLSEMTRLGVAVGGSEKTLFGLSGIGDLILTATCDTSRNRTVGLRLGKGEKLKDIVASLGSVAESVSTTPLVLSLAKKYNVSMPITEEVNKLLNDKVKPIDLVKNLMDRPLKFEY
ncbi:MAG: NAD(P)H-dependent glycerol-3-phosphate dehydrogenase [Bdellovibrionota bacterium]